MPTLAFRPNDKKLNVTFKPYMCECLSLGELSTDQSNCGPCPTGPVLVTSRATDAVIGSLLAEREDIDSAISDVCFTNLRGVLLTHFRSYCPVWFQEFHLG